MNEPPAGAAACGPTYREIAVIRLSSLGDVVLTLPVVHTLARAYPGARIHYWVKEEFADVVRNDPAVAHVRALEADARRLEDLLSMSAELEDCDLIVDLHDNARSRILTMRQKARVLRVETQRLLRSRWVHARWTAPGPARHALARYARTLAPLGVAASDPPRMSAGEAALSWSADWCGGFAGGGSVIGFCPAARHATKRWPEAYWIELGERVVKSGARVVAFSLPRERETLPQLAAWVAGHVAASWCTEPLPRQAALLGRLACVVTGDTGLMHVAAASGARVVALFGSTSPVLGFSPAGEGHTVLCRNEPCQPCTLHGRDTCPKGHFRCMREMKADEVAGAVAAITNLALRR